MFVRTERLFLRPGWPEDVDELVDAISDEAIQRNVGVSALPRTAQAMHDYLSLDRDPRLPHFFMYLRSPGGPRLVGGIGLGRFEDDVEMGYWIAPGYRGMGYAREAVRALLDQARALGHRRVVASYFENSVAMRRVLDATGFIDSGEYRERFSHARGAPLRARIFAVELDRCDVGHPIQEATGAACPG
ncbi:RimJ/RimL family protein N-acetyltransferase [Novosphingobium sp. PhB165]|uniref:GNAT family N-acetyltransferase n=1 Tax=Novosphingobium sp. PhB165 TaxID=2485105 RepID=UPI00104751E3|nr:GNAT family protein [Novosphingobium sp. PhB165]TCM17301.1 RimJ/RimL family protein N-acetyltransferase [Novosphingobium sp. PhB165]